MIDIFGGVLSAIKAAKLPLIKLPLIKLPPIELVAPGTYTIPIPANCVAWEFYGVGGGGSGGGVEGDSSQKTNATGGAGGSFVSGVRKPTAGATSITAIVAAGGVAIVATNGATNGNAGASTTASDGTVTCTAPGGGGGLAALNANVAGATAFCAGIGREARTTRGTESGPACTRRKCWARAPPDHWWREMELAP